MASILADDLNLTSVYNYGFNISRCRIASVLIIKFCLLKFYYFCLLCLYF